ncbi:hypothetical protein Tco_0661155, partial [Tanacetum coccineum]
LCVPHLPEQKRVTATSLAVKTTVTAFGDATFEASLTRWLSVNDFPKEYFGSDTCFPSLVDNDTGLWYFSVVFHHVATEGFWWDADDNELRLMAYAMMAENSTHSILFKKQAGSVMIAPNAKNKMKLVSGEFREPTMESDLRAIWERNNDMLISWILNTNCSIEVYYDKLTCFWDEYNALEAPFMCTCVCNCNNGRINGERDQRKGLIQFLMGLDESYSNIRGQILLMQPLPSAAKAYTMVRQEEKQRE